MLLLTHALPTATQSTSLPAMWSECVCVCVGFFYIHLLEHNTTYIYLSSTYVQAISSRSPLQTYPVQHRESREMRRVQMC